VITDNDLVVLQSGTLLHTGMNLIKNVPSKQNNMQNYYMRHEEGRVFTHDKFVYAN
jgi:hypothetical protein